MVRLHGDMWWPWRLMLKCIWSRRTKTVASSGWLLLFKAVRHMSSSIIIPPRSTAPRTAVKFKTGREV